MATNEQMFKEITSLRKCDQCSRDVDCDEGLIEESWVRDGSEDLQVWDKYRTRIRCGKGRLTSMRQGWDEDKVWEGMTLTYRTRYGPRDGTGTHMPRCRKE